MNSAEVDGVGLRYRYMKWVIKCRDFQLGNNIRPISKSKPSQDIFITQKV